ncbi:hypothetical protein [Okeania sp. SIO2B3]|uniref:hypothetical protein n=1 Tax=Okeania sp. SIO2B3 TaxID=2607784 RepID=UPI0013C2109A|nr:hypothetical protein [Okeania sp. SIO2B3]NET42863.1 hypothetical protein [Okeania sp. SIO2B3]
MVYSYENRWYSLEDVFGQSIQKLDRMDDKFETFRKEVNDKFEDVNDKFDNIHKEIVEIKIGQARLMQQLRHGRPLHQLVSSFRLFNQFKIWHYE